MGKDGDRDVVTIQEGLGHPAMWRVEWLEFQQKKRNEGNQFILVGLGLKFFFWDLGLAVLKQENPQTNQDLSEEREKSQRKKGLI